MSNKDLPWNSSLYLAQSVAALLAEGTPMTAKEITRTLRQRGKGMIPQSAVLNALRDGADFQGFVRLPDDRWVISPKDSA